MEGSPCSNTNQCSNAACKNYSDDNMHACCVNGRCVCTTAACSADPASPFGFLTNNATLMIVFAVVVVSIALPLLVFISSGKQRDVNRQDYNEFGNDDMYAGASGGA